MRTRALFTDETWRRQVVWVLSAIAVVLFMLRVLAAAWPTQFQIFFPDSFSFKNAALDTPFSAQFYADERPLAYPFLLFILGRSTVVTVVVQTLLYALSFCFLARTAWKLLEHRASRIIAVMLVVALGTQSRFALWNTHILSESVGITLGVLTTALWWRFSAALTTASLRWAGLATVAWITVRDSNVPPWMAFGAPALLVLAWRVKSLDRNVRQAMWRWGLITLGVAVFATLGQAANGRNRFATMNNVGQRVLTDQKITDWFVDQGMPLGEALKERTGKSSFDDNWQMLLSPDLEVFRKWADDVGQRQMLVSYVRFESHWFTLLKRDLPVILADDQSGYDAFGVGNRMPHVVWGQLGGARTLTGFHLWMDASIVALILALLRRRPQGVVLLLLLGSTFVDLYFAYVGDSVEVTRHLVGPLSRLAAISLVCAVVGLDALIGLMPRRMSASE